MGRIVSAISSNLLVRVGAAAAVALVVVGLVTGVLPVGCLGSGAVACSQAEAEVPAALALTSRPVVTVPVAVTGEPVVAEAAVRSSEVPAEPGAPKLTQNELVAATFALLPQELTRMPATLAKPADATSAEGTAPSIRVVRTTPIRIMPLQVAETPAAAAAASVAASSEPAQPDGAGSMQIAYANELAPAKASASSAEAPSETVADVAPSAPTPKAAAKGGGTSMTIVGQGANVRSSPSKGKSSVLFALAGGTSVTIGENMRGWIKVTDSRGRSGWVYKDYLR